ncbi:MAG TPA: hypothetical protein ENN66_05245 [Proteobacteria bacterium]|nr:hypothetical protein [Pseudomonadota bacterium]
MKIVKRIKLLSLALGISLALATMVEAHTPLCTCFDNGDGTITCEGGFSDGSSAAGVAMRVIGKDGKVVLEGKMNADSEFTFPRPQTAFRVQFSAGPGHEVEIDGGEISQ